MVLAQAADAVRLCVWLLPGRTLKTCEPAAPPHSSPTYLVGHYLSKLGLTEEAEMQYPDLADKITAVRREAIHTAAAW